MIDLTKMGCIVSLSPQLLEVVADKPTDELVKLSVKVVSTILSSEEKTAILLQSCPGLRPVLYISGNDVVFESTPLMLFVTLHKEAKQFEIFFEILGENYWNCLKGGASMELN